MNIIPLLCVFLQEGYFTGGLAEDKDVKQGVLDLLQVVK